MTQHRLGRPGPQRVGVVDRVASGQRRVDQRHRLIAHIGPTSSVAKIDLGVQQPPQTQMLGQGGRRHQPGVGHQPPVIEGHQQQRSRVCDDRIEKVPPTRGTGRLRNHQLPLSGRHFSRIQDPSPVPPTGGSGLSG